MNKKWKRKHQPRPLAGPTRGKYRQMWKTHVWEIVTREEEPQRDDVIPAIGAGRHHESRAA